MLGYLTDDEYEQMALGLMAIDIKAFEAFSKHFTLHLRKVAEKKILSPSAQDDFAVKCCYEITLCVGDYFALKQALNTQEKFFVRWVSWKAKQILSTRAE